MRGARIVPPLLAVVVVLAAACSGGDDAASSTAEPTHVAPTAATTGVATPTTATLPAGTPPEVVEHRDDWPLPDHDYANSRATTASRIDTTTVARPADRVGEQADGHGLVVDVAARARRHGLRRGRHGRRRRDRPGVGRRALDEHRDRVQHRPVRRRGRGWARVRGQRVERRRRARRDAAARSSGRGKLTPNPTTGVDIQPQVFDGRCSPSTVPVSIGGIYAGGDHGVVSALDAATGKVRWQFDTVDSRRPVGPSGRQLRRGRVVPARDRRGARRRVRRHREPGAVPGDAPSSRTARAGPGKNLYTDSLVALDLSTGKLRWYHQVTPHDIFDRDQVHAMIAAACRRDRRGGERGQVGRVVGLEPDDGTVRWQTEVGTHHGDDRRARRARRWSCRAPTAACSPRPRTPTAPSTPPVVNAPATLKPDKTAYFGADLGTHDGEVVAIDAATGKVQWSTKVPGDPLGGATVVNDLVFTALLDGTVLALDRDGGKIVWREKLAGGINGWMSVAGDTIVVPVGTADPPQLVALSLPSPG